MSIEVKTGFYFHYKGPLYRAIEVVPNGDDTDVLYVAQYASPNFEPGHIHRKRLAEFVELIEIEDYRIPRFSYLPEPDLPQFDQPVLNIQTLVHSLERTVAFVSLNGRNKTVINHGSDMTYELLKGEGSMVVDGEAIDMVPGKAVEIPKDTPYWDEGIMVMASTAIPPFNHAQVEVLGA